jgi:hypothetical protein
MYISYEGETDAESWVYTTDLCISFLAQAHDVAPGRGSLLCRRRRRRRLVYLSFVAALMNMISIPGARNSHAIRDLRKIPIPDAIAATEAEDHKHKSQSQSFGAHHHHHHPIPQPQRGNGRVIKNQSKSMTWSRFQNTADFYLTVPYLLN